MTLGNPWLLLLLILIIPLILISKGQLIHLSPLRRWMAVGLRLILLVLLILALADARWLKQSENLSVVFLIDDSDSMNVAAGEQALAFIEEALTAKNAEDTAGVVVFGADALVEEIPQRNLNLNSFNSIPNTGYTNFADAIRLGMAVFPADVPKRLVLISDGQNNLGDAKAAAQLATAAGIEVSTLKIEVQSGPEVKLKDLHVPNTLRETEKFDLEITVESNLSTQSEIQLYADGQLIARDTKNIQPGENRFVFPLVAGGEGFSTFQARIVPTLDTQVQNNRLDTFSLIEGPLQVLIVARTAAEVENLLPAIESAGLNPHFAEPHQMPATPLTLSEYAVVILVDLPSFVISPSQLELLQIYVRDLGRGLVVVGGPESYGAGGYFQTPLEETLPVDMALKDRERLPGMSMYMVIDKSGSMETSGLQGMGGLRKIELAKEAIYRAVNFLTFWDKVGVVAFDNAARWVVDPVSASDVQLIRDKVGTIRASGGTDILAGLQAAADRMYEEKSKVKHIVLLTDGGASPGGIPELVDNLVANDISLSIVAIGDDYAPFLEGLATRGNGRFHFARDASTIPQIFAQEATLALKAYLIEEEFTPGLTARSPILQGITALPSLHGYVATVKKDTAQMVLKSHQDDPVLAQWQYGLGRSVAWTSDAKGQWAKNWVSWNQFAQFWGQAIRWTIVEGATGNLEAQVTLDNTKGVLRLTVEALDGRGNYLNNLNLNGNLVSPSLEQEAIILDQIAPGLYQTELRPDETGAYLLRILGTDTSEELISSATRGFVVNYSPEYAAESADPTLMEDLAKLGNGQILSNSNAKAVFEHTLPPVTGSRPLWPILIAIFVLILPFDVGLRRIIFGREDLLKLIAKIRAKLLNVRPQPTAPSTAPTIASSLLSIKDRDVTDRDVTAKDSDKDEGYSSKPFTVPTASKTTPSPPPTPTERPSLVINKPIESKKPDKPPTADDSGRNDRMSRLLKAKRKAKK